MPKTTAELEALVGKREELGRQLESVTQRRHELAEQYRRADVASGREIQARMKVLDERSGRLERDIMLADDAVAEAMAEGVTRAPSGADLLFRGMAGGPQHPMATLPPRRQDIRQTIAATMFLEGLAFVLLGFVLYRRLSKRANASAAAISSDQTRFTQLQQSVDVIALEVERISEGQRYVAKMLSDNFPHAVGAGEAQQVAAKRKVATIEPAP